MLSSRVYIPFLLVFVLLLFPNEMMSQRQRGIVPVTTESDTLRSDTLITDSLTSAPAKKQPLNAPVIYEANDSIVFTKDGYAHLYGQGKVNYEQIELTAEIITMNMDSSTVFARGVSDSLSIEKGTPIFKDTDTPYETKTIRYNFRSKKGIISNLITQQGEGYVTGNNAKKGADDEIYMIDGKYTTCDNHEHPHFYLNLSRAKVRPKKSAVTGPAWLVVEDVPLPLFVPFFFFPFSSSYSSGFIMPTYMDDSNRGFGLTGGGYYFAISDMVDLKAISEIYTKGSWALGGESTYNKRYKYNGMLQANYQVTKTGDKGLPDYSEAKDLKVVWSHRQDPKASPNSTFSASVNFATSSYEKTNVGNYYNPQLSSQNTKTSSVSYSRTFPEQKLTLSGTFNIAQTMRDSSIAMTLPDMNISLSRIFPFKRKKASGDEQWYEKISLSYTGRLTNSIKTKDNLILKSNLIRDWTNGMNHSLPISATFTLFKYLNLTPSVNYTERWYSHKIMQAWNEDRKNVLPVDTLYGFYRVYNYSASLGMNTKIYGMYKPLFAKEKEIQIRHVFTPQVSISATPDFGASHYGYYETVVYTDANGEPQTREYSPYAGASFGIPGKGKQGNISFDVSNNIEMKMKSKSDTAGYRKISIVDELGASISYNMAAETKPWSDLSMRLRLKLSKSYTFNLNSSFATYAYQYDKNGRIFVGDKTEWSYGRFGRFQGYGSSFSYTFNNNTLKDWQGKWNNWFGSEGNEEEKEVNPDSQTINAEDEEQPEIGDEPALNIAKKKVKIQADSDGYQPFKIPWSLNFSYSFNIREDQSKSINEKSMRYPYSYTHTLNMSGNIKISNRWSTNFNSGYDFETNKITQTTFSVSRDLHCWSMTASLSPFGQWRSYNFVINANSSILQDLKWEQRSQTQSNIRWY
ncbi:LPS-assembly protein LptD [termite gut metagenome]|uniref:LPS-assembly protein LptD n=1 Tax=termite gut metagenome TaxID=433724 RepID=A0A5J4SGU7_9ZZZZ